MTFIYTIHPTSFDCGRLLNVNEQVFNKFYRTGALAMIDIMVSLVNTVINAFLHCMTMLIYPN